MTRKASFSMAGYMITILGLFPLLISSLPLDITLEYETREEQPKEVIIGNIPIDAQLSSHFNVTTLSILQYNFLSENEDTALFLIESQTGILRTSQVFDREAICLQQSSCSLEFNIAITPAQYFETIKVQVEILDTNDHAPQFEAPEITRELSELAPIGQKISLPSAQDGDINENTIREYYLRNPLTTFQLETTSLPNGQISIQLVLQEALDRELTDSYDLTIVASDGGNPQRSGEMLVHVQILDENDNVPVFENASYVVNVPENRPVNMTIAVVKARDDDSGDNSAIVYSFGSGSEAITSLFGIRQNTGEIYLTGILDHEAQSQYQLLVAARDSGDNSLSAFANVIVNVQDLNDNAPHITVNPLPPLKQAQVLENEPVGTFVAHLSVSDPDTGVNGEFTCSLDSPFFKLQTIKMTEYRVVTDSEFDREISKTQEFTITCQDYGSIPQISSIPVTVIIADVNDNPPVFVQDLYSKTIPENNDLSSPYLLDVNATDPDDGNNGRISYSLAGEVSQMFAIDEVTGAIRARIILDYETRKLYEFAVIARDNGSPSKSATSLVKIVVEDQNDEPPVFGQSFYPMMVTEGQPVGMEIGVVSASDDDDLPNNYVEYSFLATSASSAFAVDTINGHVRTRAVLDREEKSSYQLTVVATNVGVHPQLTGTAIISITVVDENDNAPKFEFPQPYNQTIHISSHSRTGDLISMISAYDLDQGENSRLTYYIIAGNQWGHFRIDSNTGHLTLQKSLEDYEEEFFELEIGVADHGNPPLSEKTTLNIVVNQTLPAGYRSPSSTLIGGTNLTIVVALIVSSVFIIIILIGAIIVTKMKDRRKGGGSSSEQRRMANMKIWNNTPNATSERNKNLYDKHQDLESDKNNKRDGKKDGKNKNQGSHYTITMNKQNKDMVTSVNEIDNKIPWELSANQLKNQWYGEVEVAAEVDAESASSGEVSNTDSGRGASEEGENSMMNISLQGVSSPHRHPQYNIMPPQRKLNHSESSRKNSGDPRMSTRSNNKQPVNQNIYTKPMKRQQDKPSCHNQHGYKSGSQTTNKVPTDPRSVHHRQYPEPYPRQREQTSRSHKYPAEPYLQTGYPQPAEHWENPYSDQSMLDNFPDNASSTSGSYILDSKDLMTEIPRDGSRSVVV